MHCIINSEQIKLSCIIKKKLSKKKVIPILFCDEMTSGRVCVRMSGRIEEERKERGDRGGGGREWESVIMSERKPTVCYFAEYFTSISAESHLWL